MGLLICIDDTDNPDSRGTGELAELIIDRIEEAGLGSCSSITRHQLLVHEDIPYTSHNSSMCFGVTPGTPENFSGLIGLASGALRSESAEGSDPGLAVVALENLLHPKELIAFGHRAKEEVLTKEEAYAFAEKHGIHLSEHGGTGQGIIGALAGIGLRLHGSDGRVKGRLILGEPGDRLSVEALLTHPQIDAVRDIDGTEVAPDHIVRLGNKVKTVWLDHQAVLLICKAEDRIRETCGRQQLRNY